MKIILLLFVLVISAGFVLGAVGDNAATDVGTSGQYTESPATPGQATAEGGNVTRVNVEANSTASQWQGFFGNVSGSVFLGVGSSAFYDFGSAGISTVYASRDSNFGFTTLEETTALDVSTAFSTTGVENATNVYTDSITIDGITTPSTYLADGRFRTFAADDGSSSVVNDFVFGAEVNSSGEVGFDGNTWEYELLVPVDAGTPTYYFFMSI